MKAVMISIQPYWLFLIIAKAMGWGIKQHKKIEVRKNYPKAEDWNKVVKIYCSKDKKSFDKIPEKYRPAMKKFLGKVIGKFVCDRIYDITPLCDIPTFVNRYECVWDYGEAEHGLSFDELKSYLNTKRGYGWHISDLVIYDEPKELFEFTMIDVEAVKQCKDRERVYTNPIYTNNAFLLGGYICNKGETDWCSKCKTKPLTRPPQSWCYVEAKE